MQAPRLERMLRALALMALSALLLSKAGVSVAQAQQGATMTVLRGQVAVLHPDGSALQPAPSGTTVFPGDEIRTLGGTDALITFFTGIEIEIGADTVLVVEEVSRQGERVNISLKQVFGVAVSRVQTLADPNSTYQVTLGGAVAIARGSQSVGAVFHPFAGFFVTQGSWGLRHTGEPISLTADGDQVGESADGPTLQSLLATESSVAAIILPAGQGVWWEFDENGVISPFTPFSCPVGGSLGSSPGQVQPGQHLALLATANQESPVTCTVNTVLDQADQKEEVEEEEEDREEEEECPECYYEFFNEEGVRPMTGELLASRLAGQLSPFTATGTLLALGMIGWTLYGYRGGRRH
jgi:hypothetical protein